MTEGADPRERPGVHGIGTEKQGLHLLSARADTRVRPYQAMSIGTKPTDNPATLLRTAAHHLTRYALWAGMGWVIVMMMITTLDVALRYFFDTPIPGAIELNEFMLAIFGILGMAYTQRAGGNVRVSVFIDAMPPRISAYLDSITNLLGFGVTVLIGVQAWGMGIEELHAGTTTDSLHIPVFPLYFLLSIGALALALEMLVFFAEALKKALKTE